MQGWSQAGFFRNRAVKKHGRTGKNWCQSISCLWEWEMLSQPSSRQHHMPLSHPGSLLPGLGSPRAAPDCRSWNCMEYLEGRHGWGA